MQCKRKEFRSCPSYSGERAVVGVVAGEQGGVFHEHCRGFQDKCDEELNVNEVPGAAQPPVG